MLELWIFRIAAVVTAMASGWLLYLLAVAQGGPGWEVPIDVVMKLSGGRLPLTIVAFIGFVLASVIAKMGKDIKPIAKKLLLAQAVFTCVMSAFLVSPAVAAQWPVRAPGLSKLISSAFIPGELLMGLFAVVLILKTKRA